MQIKNIEVKPYEDIFPSGILLEIEINRQKNQNAIIEVSGFLKSEDNKILAELHQYSPDNTIESEDLGARGSYKDREFKEDSYNTVLISHLGKNVINYINESRIKNSEKNVFLNIDIIIKYLENNAQICGVTFSDPKTFNLPDFFIGSEKASIMTYTFNPVFNSNDYSSWLLSGNGGNIFLSVKKQLLRDKIRISSSDWINIFAPILDIGEFFIIEVPKGKQIIKEAWEYMEKARGCFSKWDYEGVYANCREIGTLLDSTLKAKYGKNNFIYEERWGRTYKRFKNVSFNEVASLGLHLEDLKKTSKYSTDDIKIGKPDAEHIIYLTMLLIKYSEELMEV